MQLQPNTPLQEGKYIIKQLLGQGGFGNTYIAYNTEFEETVAIKEFFMKGVTERDETTSFVSVSNSENVPVFEEQKEKFKKEARRLRRLRSEHIVKVHDLFEENGTAYYEMDYIEGESLAERMKHTGTPFTEAEVDQILGQVLGALKEVHQSEIWHLDLKPGNIMLDKNGKAYLIDFGASKQIRSNGNVTTSTALCYTPGYAPNEQIGQMFDRLGPWTDIYALGATLYNILTNQKPPMTVDIEEDEEDAFDFPPTLSEKKREMIVWMMQPKRKARPQSVDEILTKLKEPKTAPQAQKTNSAAKDDEATVLIQQTAVPSEETVIVGAQQNVLLNAVDLGLSNLWADYNAGANTENLPGVRKTCLEICTIGIRQQQKYGETTGDYPAEKTGKSWYKNASGIGSRLVTFGAIASLGQTAMKYSCLLQDYNGVKEFQTKPLDTIGPANSASKIKRKRITITSIWNPKTQI